MSTVSPKSNGKLKGVVGETVVYAAHGVGKIVAREQTKVDGTDRDSVVVNLATGLQVTLPHADAMERLRPVAGASDLKDVQRVLASGPQERTGRWTERHRESKAKLAAGRVTDLAELVRDGDPSSRATRLSPAEHNLYSQARALLVREVALARGIDEDEAEAWIDAQLGGS